MFIKLLLIFYIFSTIMGCSISDSLTKQIEKSDQENSTKSVSINYYSDKTVKSLEIPPDLTKPNAQNSFRISEFYSGIDEKVIDFSDSQSSIDKKTKVLAKFDDIEVSRSGKRRWLIINKNSDLVWDIAKDFFKQKGFTIKKSNKKIGILETDFLENYPEIPDQNLGMIRKYLQNAIRARYSLPIINKYRIRIEPVDDNKTELHLSLFSMKEKLSNSGNIESTIWEAHEKDEALETEMLYELMLFFGGEQTVSRERIVNAKQNKTVSVEVMKNFNGFAKLRFNSSVLDTWDSTSWALDQLNIEIDDKDIKERSFYVNLVKSADVGIISSILGTDALIKTFQLIVNEIDEGSELIFNDISGENDQDTKEYSFEFLTKIQKLF